MIAPWVLIRQAIERRQRMDESIMYEDSVQGSTRCTTAQRYFRAILTDPQIEVLEKACARFLDDDADWLANPPTDADYEQLAGAMAALQSAEVIVP